MTRPSLPHKQILDIEANNILNKYRGFFADSRLLRAIEVELEYRFKQIYNCRFSAEANPNGEIIITPYIFESDYD